MELEQREVVSFAERLARVTTQNEEIIRRLTIQNGRVDRLEAMQWRIIVWMAAAAGGSQAFVSWLLS